MVMSRTFLSNMATPLFEAGRTGQIVRVANGDWYEFVYEGTTAGTSALLTWRKSTDMGRTWGAISATIDQNITSLAIWYDRWTPGDTTGNLIHIAWMEATTDDVYYANLDTTTGTVSAPVLIFDGASFLLSANVSISITKAKGGNLVVIYNGNDGTEEGAYKSVNAGVNWSAITNPGEATTDWFIALPGNYADTNDIDLIYWDRSADDLSYKTYDDSGNSWAETAITADASMVDSATVFPQFAAVYRLSDNHVLVFAWGGYDVATADLRCWDIIPGTSVTEQTNVVTNADDCAAVAAILDTTSGYLYVFYLGLSDGSQVIGAAVGVYYKTSVDGGATWGAEQVLHNAYLDDFRFLTASSLVAGPCVLPVLWLNDDTDELTTSAPKYPQASYQMGIG